MLEGLTVSEDFVPTYSYACTECDNRFDQVQAFSDDALTVCPQCNGRLRKLFGKVGVVFKGSGFYRNDSRDSSKSSSTASSSKSSESSTSTASSSSDSTSSASAASSSSSTSTSSSSTSATPAAASS